MMNFIKEGIRLHRLAGALVLVFGLSIVGSTLAAPPAKSVTPSAAPAPVAAKAVTVESSRLDHLEGVVQVASRNLLGRVTQVKVHTTDRDVVIARDKKAEPLLKMVGKKVQLDGRFDRSAKNPLFHVANVRP